MPLNETQSPTMHCMASGVSDEMQKQSVERRPISLSWFTVSLNHFEFNKLHLFECKMKNEDIVLIILIIMS